MKLWKFDNFLKKQTADHIEKEISTDDFPWYYLSSSCADDADFSKNNIIDSPITGQKGNKEFFIYIKN